jgi:hypothetical protein
MMMASCSEKESKNDRSRGHFLSACYTQPYIDYGIPVWWFCVMLPMG